MPDHLVAMAPPVWVPCFRLSLSLFSMLSFSFISFPKPSESDFAREARWPTHSPAPVPQRSAPQARASPNGRVACGIPKLSRPTRILGY